jgi:hypothetical protein
MALGIFTLSAYPIVYGYKIDIKQEGFNFVASCISSKISNY